MSQGRSTIGGSSGREDGEARRLFFELIKSGRAFSGHERNCCFLNTGVARFANISAISGFDFPDDGRALALTDWDQDGDLDVWVGNRSGPQVRFLNNETNNGHHYLAVRLEGRECNRDAIGARVEVVAKGERRGPNTHLSTFDPQPQTLIKTLRAGDSYLGQSTKWLHFGLGDVDEIDELVVVWPGGGRERFDDVAVDRHYRIVQGSGKVEVWTQVERRIALSSSNLVGAADEDAARVFLAARAPLPRLAYEDRQVGTVDLSGTRQRPLLVNLWASWCAPCRKELAQLTESSNSITGASLDVLALCVDGHGEPAVEPEAATRLLETLKFPFSTGRATVDLLDRLQTIHNALFDRHRPLPLPSSLLLDRDGRLAVIYKGVVEVDQILSDVGALELDELQRRDRSVPFAGRWLLPPPTSSFVAVAEGLINDQTGPEAVEYVEKFWREGAGHPRLPQLLVSVGNTFHRARQSSRAREYYQRALQLEANLPSAHRNIGIVDEAEGNRPEAIKRYRRAIELDPGLHRAHQNLAVVLAEEGQTVEAAIHFLRAANLRPESARDQFNAGLALRRSGNAEKAVEFFQRALTIQPGFAEAHYQAALALDEMEQGDESIRHFREAVQANPKWTEAHRDLGWKQFRAGMVDEAVTSLRRAAQLQPGSTLTRYRLSVVLAARGDGTAALEEFRAVLRLDPDLVAAQNGLAWLLATHSDSALRNGEEALTLAQQACDVTQNKEPQLLDTLAAAQAELRHFEDAVATATIALRLARKSYPNLIEPLESRLHLYQNGEPYRDR